MHRLRDPWLPAALGVAFALLAVFAVREIGSHDLGFHLRAGESILETGSWPRTDAFTFTVNDHAYTDTSWGFQVIATTIERLFGVAGLGAWQVLIALFVLMLVARTARSFEPEEPVLAVLLLVAVIAIEIRIDVRPEWLSYLLLAATLHVLVRHESGREGPLWLLPVLQLVWVNVHSLFVLGQAATACFVVGSWIQDRRLDRRLLAWAAVAVPVTLVNPYGYEALLFPLTLLTRFDEQNVFGSTIGELYSVFSVDRLPFYPRSAVRAVWVLLGAVLISLVPLWRRRRISHLLLAFIFVPLALQAVRNVPLLVVACLPATAGALRFGPLARQVLPVETRDRLKRGVLALAIVVALLVGARVVSGAYYVADRRQVRFGAGWNPRMLPVAAADWAESAGLRGRMLNDLGFGGYLMWRLKRPVFIDGRLEVMGEAFFEEYRAALASRDGLNAAATRHRVEWLILPYRSHDRLVLELTRAPSWRLAYVDGLSAVYVRRASTVRPHPGVSRPAPETIPPRQLPGLGAAPRSAGPGAWLRGLVVEQSFPSEAYNLGQFHYFRGDFPKAFAWFAQAIDESGGAFPELYRNLGAAAWFGGRRDEARRIFEYVLALFPGDPYASGKLAELGAHGPGA